MTPRRAIVLSMLAALCAGSLWWSHHASHDREQIDAAQRAATEASRAMVAADKTVAEVVRHDATATSTLYVLGDETPASLDQAAFSIRLVVAALDADISARDTLLARSAAWFALAPDAERSVRGALDKIRAGQIGLNRTRDAYNTLRVALDAHAPREQIEQLRNEVTTVALLGAVEDSK